MHSDSHGLNVKNSVAVWNSIYCVNGVPVVMNKLDCRLDTSQYKKLLSAHVFLIVVGGSFIHDYSPVHTRAKSVKEFISCNRIQAFEGWPKKSGDLMPLEIVWKQIVNKVNGKLVFYEDDLWSELSACWELMDQEGTFVDIIHTPLNRSRKVIQNEGDWVFDNDLK